MTLKNTRQKRVPWYRGPVFLWPCAIVFLVLVTFWPVIHHGFFNMDDLPLITGSRLLLHHELTDLGKIFSHQLWSPHYKPFVNITWMIERDLFGIDPAVMHFNNMLLHAANAVLVFFFIVRLIPLAWKSENQYVYIIGGFSALLWAVHPLRVESVAWAVERKDVLFGLCYLLACHAWLSHLASGKGWKWLFFATLFYILACLSKSMAITFPAVAFLLDYVTKRSSRIILWDKLPLAIVMLLMLYLYGYLGYGDASSEIDPMRKASAIPGVLANLPPIIQHVLIANFRLCLFIGHTLLPVSLAVVYPREAFLETLGAGIYVMPVVILILLGITFRKSLRRSVYAFALFWFIVTISPILSGEGVGTNFMSDRYTYIPSIAAVFAIVMGIYQLFAHIFNSDQKRRILIGSVIPGILVLVSLWFSRQQTQIWHTNLSLWQQAIDHYPGNWYALYNRAKLTAGENLQAALDDLRIAIERMPAFPALYYARGTLLMQQDKPQEAIADFDRVLAKEPDHIEARINRGNSLRSLNRHQDAIADYNAVLQLKPKLWKAMNNRGLAYLDMGQFEKAGRDFSNAISGDPDYANPYLNRGNLRLRPEIADYNGAIEDLSAYLKLIPDAHDALFRRGYARMRLGQAAEALTDMNAAIRLYDQEGFYFVGRAQAYQLLGNNDAAQRDLQQARKLGVKTNQ